MTVANVSHAASAGTLTRHEQQARQNRHFSPGDQVLLRIVRKLDSRHYVGVLGNEQHVIESTVELSVGSRVQAAVAATGEKLELRYVGVEAAPETGSTETATGGGLIAALENKFATSFTGEQRQQLEKALSKAGDANAMALGGVFLNKLALPIDIESLTTVHDEQVWTTPATGHSAATLSRAIHTGGDETEILAEHLRAALDAASAPMSAPVQGAVASATNDFANDDQDARRSARELLNVQDDGSVTYAYGVLPLMIGDQLVELDLAYFRERRDTQATDGMRRMVMTFSTRNLGRIEVLAQSIGDRLAIDMKTDAAASSDVLASHAEQVRDLVARLGWQIDSVSYSFNPNGLRAARHIVDHVAQSDTLSRFI
ncbi:MAG TPA: flagellar hook-length control protein FliK [Steroidobacteraceae bacterium]|nr:flagellar hook-length control protein FliK [Steroidobacteraceae bacterium]